MPRHVSKVDFPVRDVRRYLEPGPVVLVSSAHGGQRNIMTLGWHVVLEFSPSLIGLMIAQGNVTHDLVRASRECVVNLPTTALLDTAAKIGNSDGGEGFDKFDAFDLTAVKGHTVDAPLIAECHASFECRLHDDALVDSYGFFIFEVVKAHVAPRPKRPQTFHYRGDGEFMVSGRHVSRKALFTKVS